MQILRPEWKLKDEKNFVGSERNICCLSGFVFSFIVSESSQVFSFLFQNFIKFNDEGWNFNLWTKDVSFLLDLHAPNLIYCVLCWEGEDDFSCD